MHVKLDKEETRLSEEAREYVVKHQKELIKEFANPEVYKPATFYVPTSTFTAGWPGVGKTEHAQFLIKYLPLEEDTAILHLDIDKCREFIPQYNGKNSYVVQSAAIKAVDLLFDYAHRRRLHYILDSTFANEVTLTSLGRAIRRDRNVFVDFIYLDPLIAWWNTQARAKVEGRFVPKEVFIEAYFNSVENMRRLKKVYGDAVNLSVIIKRGAL
jgi:UDP-N-acetylglucosamine kinase